MTGFLRLCDGNEKTYRFVIDLDES